MKVKTLLTSLFALCLLMAYGYDSASATFQSQDSLGGPYTTDSATVLLLHFDGDIKNSTDKTADPKQNGNLSFISGMEGAGSLNQQLRIDNDSPQDSSWMTVADTAALDMTGSWTLELWINVFTYGNTQDDWRIGPRPIFKPGDPDEGCYCFSNYFFNIYGVEQNFNTGYYADQTQTWIEVRSKSNLLHVGEWYHLTFIRDTSKNVILQMIHQTPDKTLTDDSDKLELTYFESQGYGPDDHPPRVNDQPLYIGASPQNDFSIGMLDGFVDEIRISNVVRNFNVPPIIKDVTTLNNQEAGKDYEIDATIQTIGDAKITEPTLHYRVNEGTWNSMTMAAEGNQQYSATIPSQEVGDEVEYWIGAKTESGLSATNPAGAKTDSIYHNFAVWTDSTEVFSMNFDGAADGEVPADRSKFGADIAYNGGGSPAYAAGDEGGNDQAMVFNASDSTWLETSSAVHQLSNFAVDFKFYAQDSVPATDTRLLSKGSPSALYWSNYQVYFDPGGAVRPAIFAGDNGKSPCGSYTGGCLVMDQEGETIEAEKWYRVQIGIRGPEAAPDTTGSIFARVIDIATQDTVGERIHPVNGDATHNSSSLKIGGVGNASQAPYFNGKLDDITIYNYLPASYLPDSLTQTSIGQPAQLPQQVTLGKNYPNPFNPTTQIDYNLPSASDVQLTVYDVLGRRVATLIDGKQAAGAHTVTFDASGLSSGVYLYRLKTGEVTKSRKMLLVK